MAGESTTGAAERGDAGDRAGWFFAILIAIIGALNLLVPRKYFLFGIHHASYLSPLFQVSWTLLAVALAVRTARPRAGWHMPRVALPAIAALFIASFFVFRTHFPTLQGDGPMGGSPYFATAPVLRDYPGINGRLQSFLSYALTKAMPQSLRFEFYRCGVGQDEQINNAWVLFTMLCGTALVLLVTGLLNRSRLSGAAKVGLQLTCLAAPAMMNAYGHFDSYIVPVLALYLWFGAALLADEHPQWAAPLLMAASLIGAWAHPILGILVGYVAILLFLRWTGRSWPLTLVLGAGALFALAPLAAGRPNRDLVDPANRAILGWLLHEKAMSLIQVALPALALAAAVLVRNRTALRRPAAMPAFGLGLLVSSLLMFLTLWFGYGVQDEFLYGLLGTLVLGAAIILWRAFGGSERVILCAGVLSLYLYVPRMAVYSNDLQVARLQDILIYDRCCANRYCSPHRLLALSLPLETPEYRELRLKILEDGFLNAPPHLDPFREEALATYVAWCFEFGEYDRGTLQLLWLIDNYSDHLVQLWDESGPYLTGRYRNVAPGLSRLFSRRLLDQKLAEKPDDYGWNQMREHLKSLDQNRTPPAPLRAP